ncbi:MAG: hypothetical protein BMS9Abin36_1894 [Gammaproteobacteria bacterium]|nr:MAG: hypothetical protein BMS9Abin36_1894 [Gammaproteobacteria bacterium]
MFALMVLALVAFMQMVIRENTDTRNLTCLALNVYFEARGEPRAGQRAVAEVTLNRVASRHYPDTICEVVYQENWDYKRRRNVSAFSWTELNKIPGLKGKTWQAAWEAAEAVYFHRFPPLLDGALFYHARRIRPAWAKEKRVVARIGRHIFYQ